jgi:hypothetical protein
MTQVLQQNASVAAYRRVYLYLVQTDGITPATGQTGTGKLSKNGVAPATTAGSLVEVSSTNDPGRYYIELTTGELDTLGFGCLRYKSGSTLEGKALIQVVPDDPFTAGASVTAIADAYLDRVDGVEGNLTPRQQQRAVMAAVAALVGGLGGVTVTARDFNNTKNRITATVDSNGNVSAITFDLT